MYSGKIGLYKGPVLQCDVGQQRADYMRSGVVGAMLVNRRLAPEATTILYMAEFTKMEYNYRTGLKMCNKIHMKQKHFVTAFATFIHFIAMYEIHVKILFYVCEYSSLRCI